jgi:hypothetical protein
MLYLSDGESLKSELFGPVGHRIAFLIRQPVLGESRVERTDEHHGHRYHQAESGASAPSLLEPNRAGQYGSGEL